MEAIVKAAGLKKYYGKGEALVKALDGVDLEIERGSLPPSSEQAAVENQRFLICWEGWMCRVKGA